MVRRTIAAAAAAGLIVIVGHGTGLRGQPAGGTGAVANLAGKVLTVKGPIDPAALGPTLTHEHIFIDFKAPPPMMPPPTGIRVIQDSPKERRGGLTDYGESLAEVMEFRKAGGGTIVDLSNFGLTRDPEALLRVSNDSGLNVVMGAGWYMKTLHPPDMDERTVEDLTAILVRDITAGAQGTRVRSGVIGEVGTGAFGDRGPLTENEIKSVRASARASRITGAPIVIHSFAPPAELQRALDIIASEGVALDHVAMAHTGTGNVEAMKRYTDRGAYVEFDFIGQAPGVMGSRGTLEQGAERVAADIRALIDAGLTDRVLLAHDVCIQGQLKRNGGGGYAYISNMVAPALRAKGVSEAILRRILVDNPARLLTFVAPQPPLAPR